ncbi:MAG: AI-2E family transporter [Xanthobacteraceae bacterium]
MDYIRAKREVRHALVISDPQPLDGNKMWASAGQAATVGIFLLLFGTFLYIGHAILLPVLAAAVVSLTLAPLIKALQRLGISPWITGLFILLVGLGVLSLLATALAGPVSRWIAQAPEIGATIQQKLTVLDRPLAALHELEGSLFGANATLNVSTPNVVLPVVAFLTPAAGELLLFFVTLYFFLVGQTDLRNHAVTMFASRDSKLRFLKIMHDIERNLAGYLTVVTIINAAVGIIVAVGAWLIGLPNPVIFGVLAALFNYVPYLGPAVMVMALFGVGLVTFPSLSHAFVAPLGLIAVTTTEGHFVTPTIVGRRLTLNPLMVFLALAFWTWMWGPFGAVLAVPLSIIGLVIFNHLVPAEEIRLPE